MSTTHHHHHLHLTLNMNVPFCSWCCCNTQTETNSGNDTQKSFRIITNQPRSTIDEKRLPKVISVTSFVSPASSTKTGVQPSSPSMDEWSPERSTVSSGDTSSFEAEDNTFVQNIIRTMFLDVEHFQND